MGYPSRSLASSEDRLPAGAVSLLFVAPPRGIRVNLATVTCSLAACCVTTGQATMAVGCPVARRASVGNGTAYGSVTGEKVCIARQRSTVLNQAARWFAH